MRYTVVNRCWPSMMSNILKRGSSDFSATTTGPMLGEVAVLRGVEHLFLE